MARRDIPPQARPRTIEQGRALCADQKIRAFVLERVMRDIRHTAPRDEDEHHRRRHAGACRNDDAGDRLGRLFHHRHHGGVRVCAGGKYQRRRLQEPYIDLRSAALTSQPRGCSRPGHRERQPFEGGEQHQARRVGREGRQPPDRVVFQPEVPARIRRYWISQTGPSPGNHQGDRP